MFKNYLKIAWRNILREKGYAFINIFSLAVGIAFCILIYLFIHDELTYDHFHKQGDRIFRVEGITLQPDGSHSQSNLYGPVVLGPALKADIPGIERYTRLQQESHFVRAQGTSGEAVEEDVLFVDPTILKAFTFPLLQGNPAVALANPDNVVLTEKIAQKYFGNSNPMGKTLQILLDQKYENFVVTGVAEDIPGNSTIQFGILLPFKKLLMYNKSFANYADSWHFFSPRTYVELAPGVTKQQVEANLPAFYKKYYKDDIARDKKEGRYDSEKVSTYELNPIREIHLARDSSPVYSYILGGIALAVLIIACINFMTLSMGRSARRAKEVGVRKVVGAERKQIMVQFWGEAFLLSGLALVLGLMMAEAFLPVFGNLTGKSLGMGMAANWTTGFILVGLVVVISLVAGSYPALILSGFHPIETLAKQLHFGKAGNFSKSLVVFQFAVTIFLIISTFIMARQIIYTRSMDLGFNKEQVVVIPTQGLDAGRIADRFRSELGQQTSIVDVTASGNKLGRRLTMGVSFEIDGKRHTISVFRVDSHYLNFLDLHLIAGRNFNPNRDADSSRAVIVNQALVDGFGFKDPIGQTIPGFGPPGKGPKIIGVVKDYHFQSLYNKVGSVMLTQDPSWEFKQLLVRIRPENIPQSLDLLKKAWRKASSGVPFSYHFLDDQMQAQYANDQRWSHIIRYSSFFAILISCLGLLGLTALAVTRRAKEIGIRKVLGAKVNNIVGLLSKEFLSLVLIGFVIAVPIAWYAMHKWLADFAYKISIGPGIFLLAGGLALFIALVTVSWQSIRAALANPVDSLRSE